VARSKNIFCICLKIDRRAQPAFRQHPKLRKHCQNARCEQNSTETSQKIPTCTQQSRPCFVGRRLRRGQTKIPFDKLVRRPRLYSSPRPDVLGRTGRVLWGHHLRSPTGGLFYVSRRPVLCLRRYRHITRQCRWKPILVTMKPWRRWGTWRLFLVGHSKAAEALDQRSRSAHGKEHQISLEFF